MRSTSATLLMSWVRKLIGKLRVPYNRGLRVRGSPHPFISMQLTNTGSSKQGASKPFGLVQSGSLYSSLDCPLLVGVYPRSHEDASRLRFWQLWPTHFRFHYL